MTVFDRPPSDQSPLLVNGGAEGSRTPDLLIANETLYQLSYDPNHFKTAKLFPRKTWAQAPHQRRASRSAGGKYEEWLPTASGFSTRHAL
jgi:hypothetical protein